MLVVDLSGWHVASVRFCKCSKSGFLEDYQQLLRFEWYPASQMCPKTAFTFDLLDTYHKISLQGKLNLYDFYNAVMQKTDNYGSSKVVVRELLLLTALSTSFVPKSTATTKCRGVYDNGATLRTSSEVEQDTHPLRSTNSTTGLLPLSAPPAHIQDETYRKGGIPSRVHRRKVLIFMSHITLTDCARRWLYSLFLAIDANFRLKLKARDIQDPELGAGLSYFVDPVKF